MSQKKLLTNRHEFIFLYDVSKANPNGDPLADNMPRYDERRGVIFVSDDRIKRTVRDTLNEMGHKVFLLPEVKDDGNLQTRKERFAYFGGKVEKVIENCIDVRLFGDVFTLGKDKERSRKKKKGVQAEEVNEGGNVRTDEEKTRDYTGPVQILWAESLHRVYVQEIGGTSVMPSQSGKSRGTMTREYKVRYALIGVYGVVNHTNGKRLNLTEEDVEEFFKALWIGHSGGSALLTTSKIGHRSRLLLDIVHKENSLLLIGDLTRYIKLYSELPEEEVIKIDEFTVDLSGVAERLLKHKNRIEKIRYAIDDVKLSQSIGETFKDLPLQELEFENL